MFPGDAARQLGARAAPAALAAAAPAARRWRSRARDILSRRHNFGARDGCGWARRHGDAELQGPTGPGDPLRGSSGERQCQRQEEQRRERACAGRAVVQGMDYRATGAGLILCCIFRSCVLLGGSPMRYWHRVTWQLG